MSSSEYWKGLTHNEIRARVVQYMETLLTQARTLVPYRFSSPATSLPAADLVFWKVSHGCRGPFVSRTASFPTTSGSPQCSDLAYLGQYAWGATGNENMQRGMRRCCLFSFAVSYRDRLTCGRVSCLTSCHRRVVSYSCHFFRKNG